MNACTVVDIKREVRARAGGKIVGVVQLFAEPVFLIKLGFFNGGCAHRHDDGNDK